MEKLLEDLLNISDSFIEIEEIKEREIDQEYNFYENPFRLNLNCKCLECLRTNQINLEN